MSNYLLLKDIIRKLEDFEHEQADGDINDFSLWLQSSLINKEETKGEEVDFTKKANQNKNAFQEVILSTYVSQLFKYARHYSKKALQQTSIKSLDEFGLLAHLLNNGEMVKSELIQSQLLELSTGTEIIKRLVKSGFVTEVTDNEDRRVRRIRLHNKGKAEVIKSFAHMHKAAQIVKGKLTLDELLTLNGLLQKLQLFHNQNYEFSKQSSLDEIIENVL